MTLLPGLTAARATPHYEAGVVTVPQLARLDSETAAVVELSEDLDRVVYSGADDDESLSAYLPPSQVARLAAAGYTRAGQINELHQPTLRYAGSRVPKLADQIDQARVELAQRVHRRRGEDSVSVPRAAVELDVDIEDNNTGDNGICYMIGTLLTVRTRGTVVTQYLPFYTWENTPEAEAECFARFFTYVEFLRDWARSSGTGGFKSYFYSNHETRYFRHLAKKHEGWTGEGSLPNQKGVWQDPVDVAVPTSDDLEAFFASGDWVDMRPILEGDLMWPTRSHSLKDLAKYVKFMWRDDTPGGGNSVAWYAEAIDDENPAAAESRQRLLDYNEDDVYATLALRDFLTRLGESRRPGAKLPSVESLHERYNPRY